MVITAVCWVVVLAFGPKTMTHRHQTTDTPRSAGKVSESSKEEKAKQDAAKAEEESSPAQKTDESTAPSEAKTETAAEIYPLAPEPVVADPAVPDPIQQIILPKPKPELPKFPPACGVCGRMPPRNSLTIQCPMYEMPRAIACALP